MKNRPVVILHWTGTTRDTTYYRAIEALHKLRKYPVSKKGYHTAYNTLIESSGNAFYAREYTETGQATGTFNNFHIDICLTGTTGEIASQEQMKTLELELTAIEQMYGSYILKGHYQYYPTACPGHYLKKYINDRT